MYALPLASVASPCETAASILDVLILSAGSAGTHLAVWAAVPDPEEPDGVAARAGSSGAREVQSPLSEAENVGNFCLRYFKTQQN